MVYQGDIKNYNASQTKQERLANKANEALFSGEVIMAALILILLALLFALIIRRRKRLREHIALERA